MPWTNLCWKTYAGTASTCAQPAGVSVGDEDVSPMIPASGDRVQLPGTQATSKLNIQVHD
eukprot:763917-Rhodomonas_salina.1